jgi:3-hydroxybutyryl-CoA dehydrogenase
MELIMDIKKVGVVGCGFMGGGIVQVCATAGYDVLTTDISDTAVNKGIDAIKERLTKKVGKKTMTQQHMDDTIARIKGSSDNRDLKECDLVIESVFEDMELKKRLFAELDSICLPHTIFGTNTSCLPVVDMAMATSRPDKVVGIHFFTPPPLMPCIEIMESIVTSKETLKTAIEFGKSVEKTVIVAKDTPGFIVNALMIPNVLNAIRMLESGIATKEDIDLGAVMGLSHPIGPIALADFFGLDVLYSISTHMYDETKEPQLKPPLILKRMVKAGWLGRKTGKGFYDYTS